MAKHVADTPHRKVAIIAGITAALLTLGAGAALAEPAPPTNAGNGAGASGQCTGPAAERPTACQSPGGVAAH